MTNMQNSLIVPPTIQTIIDDFDTQKTPFTEMDISSSISKARSSLANPSPAENLGAWAEQFAFVLQANVKKCP